jgi:hypothetical protein
MSVYIKVIEKAKSHVAPYSNICIDTCHEMRVSGPLNDKYLVDLFKKIDALDKKNVVIGIQGMQFEMRENKDAGLVELVMTGNSHGIKLCKVVF